MYHEFLSKFLSHSTKKYRRGTLVCFRKNRISKNLMHKNGISLISVEKFLSHSAEKICREPFPCFKKNLVSKHLLHRKGISLKSAGNLLSHSAKKLCTWSLLYFKKFLVSKKFKDKRNRGNHNFPSKTWRLTVSKNIVGETFCVSEKNWYRKLLWISGRRKDNHDFSQIFLPHSIEKFRRGSLLCFKKLRMSDIFMDKRKGGVSQFFSKFFSHSTEKNRRATLMCFRRNLVTKNVMDTRRRSCITIFRQSFSLTVPKIFEGEPFCGSEKHRVSKNFTHKKGISFFVLLNFCPTESKSFVGEHVWVSENFVYRKILWIREEGDVSRIFVKVFVSQYQKVS